MKPIFFFALVFLAITVVSVRAEEKDDDDPRTGLFKVFGSVKNFLKTDPIGQKIRQQFTEFLEIAKELRRRFRQKLGKYIKELQEES